jgi:tetratricopeptide (TPR) repeat protein
LRELALLRLRYPRNRLVWLEAGSTALRAGRASEAEQFLADGMTRFADDRRQRMFGEDALWAYKRGAARATLGRNREAEADLNRSLALEGRKWVHGRAHLELGSLALKAGNRTRANEHFRTAVQLCESDNDQAFADDAKRLIR